MAIKIAKSAPEPSNTPKFPRVMQYKPDIANKVTPLVVLFITEQTGVVLSSITPKRIGCYEDELISCFEERVWEPAAFSATFVDQDY